MAAVHRRAPNSPQWPSLYDPGLEILHIPHRSPTQPGATYLYDAHDIFRFTLYWTLILYTPMFLVCGTYAFINLSSLTHSRPHPAPPPAHRQIRTNERTTHFIFAVLVLLTFLVLSVAGAVVGSAIMSVVLYGFFKAAKYNMSTWIPFIWALILTLVGLLGIWPSVIDII